MPRLSELGLLPGSPAEAVIPVGSDRLLPLPVVMILTTLSKSKLYLDMQRGSFPRPVKLGPRKAAWRHADVQRWLASQTPASNAA